MFCVTTFIIRFVKNLFRKVKGENLKLFNCVDASKIYETKIYWIKANQLLPLQLTGLETLESASQNFKLRFHFLFLVSVAVDKLTARGNWVDEA